MTVWVGADPGSRETGIVAREGRDLLAWAIIDMRVVEPGAEQPGRVTFDAITGTVRQFLVPGARVAVERFKPPNPHVTRKNGRSTITIPEVINTSLVIGYLLGVFPDAVLVDPAGNGSQILAAYPRELVGPVEYRNAVRKHALGKPAPQNGHMRHARSGWDVAGTAAMADRLTQAAHRHH